MCNLPRNGSYFLDSVPHTKHLTCNANQWTEKNTHHALSVFDTFPAIFWLPRNVFEVWSHWKQGLSVASKCGHETKKHVLIGCHTWCVLPPNIWSLIAVKANCRPKGKSFICFWSACFSHISFFSTFSHISRSETAHLPSEIILNV